MDVHVRIGDNHIFVLKQAVLLNQEGNRAFATLHEVRSRPDGPLYLCAGQSVTTGFLEVLAKGLGASMAPEILPGNVVARTPEMIAWWSPAQRRIMFFGGESPEISKLNGHLYPHPAPIIHGLRAGTVCPRSRGRPPPKRRYTSKKCALLEHRWARQSVPG